MTTKQCRICSNTVVPGKEYCSKHIHGRSSLTDIYYWFVLAMIFSLVTINPVIAQVIPSTTTVTDIEIDYQCDAQSQGMLMIIHQPVGSDTSFTFGNYHDTSRDIGYVLANDSFARIMMKSDQGLRITWNGEPIVVTLRYDHRWAYEAKRDYITIKSSSLINIIRTLSRSEMLLNPQ